MAQHSNSIACAPVRESIPAGILGFGLMRLPKTGEGDAERIDEAQVAEMVDAFLAAGCTYFDTAWGYSDGESELTIRRTLVERYPRTSFQLATKLPAWRAADSDAAREMLSTSLERTGAGYFDAYLLHNLGDDRTQVFEDYKLWDFCRDLRERGIVKRFGFSIHDKADALEAVLEAHPDVDFVQLQINYADWDNPRIESRACYEVAREHGVPVIVMEPLKGGMLMKLSDGAVAPLRKARPDASLASWGLRFAASLPGVERVLSGMSSVGQMRENLDIFGNVRPLDAEELSALEAARVAIEGEQTIPCTDCRYCVSGCPQGVAIPVILEALNFYSNFGDLARARGRVSFGAKDGVASKCVACGACERACPQHIDIISQLSRAAKLFEDGEQAK